MAIMKVLVVGGGIGGITCMLALRQHEVDAQLFEQAAAFGQVGAGIQVLSNAARILLKLGLGAALKKVATYPEARDYRGWDTGERLYYTPLGQKAEAHFGSPYYAAHRAELLDVLLGELDEYGIRAWSRAQVRRIRTTEAYRRTLCGRHDRPRRYFGRRRRDPFNGPGAAFWQRIASLHRQCRVARSDPCRARCASQFGQRGGCMDGAKS